MQPAPPAPIPETVFVEGSGKAFNTIPPSDFGFFELMNELVQDEPAGSTEHRADGPAGRDRDRQGQAVRARRADAAHPRGRGRRRQRDLAGAVLRPASVRRSSRTTTDSAWFNMLLGRRLHVRDAAAARHRGRDQAVPSDRRPEAALPDVVLLRGHRGHARRCACGSPGSGRSTSWPSRTPTGTASTARKTYQVTLPPDIPAARFWSFTALRQRDALDAADAAALPARREPVLPDTGGDRERRRLDDRHVRPGAARRTARRATGSRRPRARAGSRSCASTARSQPFFDKSWRPSEIEVVN